MMRSIIVGLSVLFFSLSAIVTYKALELPAREGLSQDLQPEIVLTPPPQPAPWVTPETADVLSDTAEDQPMSRIADAGMENVIPQHQPENQPAATEKSEESIGVAALEAQPRTLAIFGGKTFRSGQDVIHDVAYSMIENLVKEITASPRSSVLIEGHTDNVPTGKLDSDNVDLSFRRAKAIANILMLHGISPERIIIKGYGDTRPIDSNNTEEGRAKNRRVEVKLMPKEGDN